VLRYLGQPFSAATASELVAASGLTIDDIIARAHAGDKKAIGAIESTARFLGAGMAVIVNTLSPGQICVGGEIIEAWDIIAPIIRRTIADRALTDAAAATPVVPEKSPSEARLRGATTLVAAPRYAAPKIA
jgi:predicted NBD/HSP70 family sugar kinase